LWYLFGIVLFDVELVTSEYEGSFVGQINLEAAETWRMPVWQRSAGELDTAGNGNRSRELPYPGQRCIVMPEKSSVTLSPNVCQFRR
jgi:hypothetical protein